MTPFDALAHSAAAAAPGLLLLALKATAVLAAAAVAGRLLTTAAHRHLVWWLALVGIAALPLAALLLPPVALPLHALDAVTVAATPWTPPPAAAEQAAVVPLRSTWTPPEVAAPAASLELPTAAPRTELAAPAPIAPALPAPSRAAAAATPSATTSHWPAAALVALWLGGVAVLLASLARDVGRRQRLAREATVVTGDLASQLEELVTTIRVARRPRLLAHPAIAVPVTWGLLRPILMVPAAAAGWPSARRRDVLLHELAHIRRGDHAAELLAQLATIVHWPNPLAWRALRRLRTEAEHACDDTVLAAGSRATSYADHLLAAARFGRERRVPAATVAMARRPQLGERIRAILDPERRRRPLAPLAAVVSMVVATLVVGGLAAVSLAAPAEPLADPAPETSEMPRHAERTERAAPRPPDAPRPPEAPSPPDAPRPPEPSAPLDASAPSPPPPPEAPRPPHPTAAPRPPATPEAPAPWRLAEAPRPPQAPPTPRAARAPRPPRAPAAPPIGSGTSWTGTFVLDETSDAFAGIPGFDGRCDDDSTAVKMRIDDGDVDLQLDRGDCRFDLEIEGAVTFSADERDVATLGRRGRLEVSPRIGGPRRAIPVAPGAPAEPRYSYRVDGAEAPVAEGRRWLAEMIPLVYRLTGYDATARVERLLARDGFDGVLAEVRAIPFDSVQRAYLAALARQASPSTAQAVRLLAVGGAELGSDYELAELLVALQAAGLVDDAAVGKAYAAAVTSLGSDYEMRRALQPLVLSRPDVAVLDQALEAARSLGSDYELAELLIAMAEAYPSERELPPGFLATLATLGSDYEHRRVLDAFLDRGVPPPPVLDRLLGTLADLGSDYEAAELLSRLAGLYPADAELPDSFFSAVRGIGSDYEASRVMQTVVSRGALPSATLVATLETAREIGTDHELANLLERVAQTQRLAGAAAEAFDRALGGIGSRHERERVERSAARGR